MATNTDPLSVVGPVAIPRRGQGGQATAASEDGSAARPRGAEVETFDARSEGGARLALRRLRSPLGIYTTPLVLLVLWQAAGWAGMLPAAVAASPIQVINAGVHLWRVGEPSTLGEDLKVSLTRAGIGFLLGVSVAGVAATFAGLGRLGTIAIDGTKIAADASRQAACRREWLRQQVDEIVAQHLPVAIGDVLDLHVVKFGRDRCAAVVRAIDRMKAATGGQETNDR